LRGSTVPLALPLAAWSGARAVLSPLADAWRMLGRRHSIARDARCVRRHYDLSTDFYRLFLDDALVYSCAYFARGDESIGEAQQAKLELTCRKLHLKRGDHLLDVGCGWGALLIYAAERFGVKAMGTTVSRTQFLEASRRAVTSHAAGDIRVLDCDYRQLPTESVHKIVSVGMMEHVGARQLDQYFAELYSRLRPGGLLLNHAIADGQGEGTIPWTRRWSGGFIEREIFPDTELPPLDQVIGAAERQRFEVRDVDSLREHYAETLRQWLVRFDRRFDDAAALVGLRRARAWRLYLAGCAAAFRLGRINVYQTLLAKRTASGRARDVPRSRAAWYAERPPSSRRRPDEPSPGEGMFPASSNSSPAE
jgi:cyclopropane-fatty-acyl-phospholipid synthase